ncbi:sigma 54-interacting transcriptional regulator [Olsenella sp. An293]|uniref:sigma 54-interacting transcriptional regulator n=1 Tax=Olsenella sp. An293 TaxID=1965626 RepID=UPI000B37404A|nr:sigma 54-interacting transcriptional regulator [Olsenella sp. An293]OUO33884.1 hypothetical protein B5F85_00735 [Olsenella sp. An293]
MNVPETERELFSYLCSMTRELAHTEREHFTTQGISQALTISRNLASHYLNDLVRGGLVVKAGTRPVYYFSRRDLERVLQTGIDRLSWSSVDELLSNRAHVELRDFERAVGYDLSLGSAVEKLKAAVKYPPQGLPVLISGDKGTGKTLLSTLMCEYGVRIGALSEGARTVVVNCSDYTGSHASFVHDLNDEKDGWLAACAGGVVVFRDVERLSPASASLLLRRAAGEPRDRAAAVPARLVLLTTCQEDDLEIAPFVQEVPVVVRVPALRERTIEEREELVLGLFKEEGRKLGADVFVSRTAFSCLVEADFKDNVRGLRSCITSCCASAYLNRSSDRLEVQAFLLPGFVLDAAPSRMPANGDVELIDTTRALEHKGDSRSVRAFSAMLESYRAYEAGDVKLPALMGEVQAQVKDYEDYLVFDADAASSRAMAYERIITGIVDDVGATYGIDLSKKSARVIARCIHAQVHPGSRLSKWRIENRAELAALLALLVDTSDFCRRAADRLTAQTEAALGLRLDVLSRIFVFAVVQGADRRADRRQSVGIILSHGYSTATSIADAANRILRQRVFEAIDMSYEQDVSDIMGPLRNLLDTYAFCREIVLLVDMGSLENVLEGVGEMSNVTLGIVNNASTGMALEVGSGLASGEPIESLLPHAAEACTSRFRIMEGRVLDQAVVFCSEGGPQAADRIRSLIERSLEVECPLRFLACSPEQLRHEGITERYDVLAVIGTDDPCVEGVPFIALEDIISGEGGLGIDEVFARYLDETELERFHQSLVKNLTLRNVIESITILNPEKVLDEVGAAVAQLQQLMGERFAPNILVGLSVHLCCLVERLVTRSPIETYADVDAFTAGHADFIELFRRSFSDISRRYGVEVPVTEIAYAFDYVRQSTRRTQRGGEEK